MANLATTIFQNLNRAISGGWQSDLATVSQLSKNANKPYTVNKYNFPTYGQTNGSDIIYRTNSLEDKKRKEMELKQQYLLSLQWVKANVDLANDHILTVNDVKMAYRDFDLMDQFPEIAAALDIVSEESCCLSDKGTMVNVYSPSERVKAVLEDLFVRRLDINVTLPMICREMCKYGNHFNLLNVNAEKGIMGWKQLPVYDMERYDIGTKNPYIASVSNGYNKSELGETTFVWVGNNEAIPYRNWQIAHFRLLTSTMYLPYGCIVGDSIIDTENGSKPISEITVGEKVWTYNIDTKERELTEVTDVRCQGIKDVYEARSKHHRITGTADHKVLVHTWNGLQYKEIKDLHNTDYFICYNEEGEQVQEKVFANDYVGKDETYDITVANGNRNFIANGIVVHNCSYIWKARRHWKLLTVMEDMMLIYRMERSIERRVFKIYVGNIDDQDVPAFVNQIAENFKRTPVIDPLTGQVDLRKASMGVDQDYFIPVRDPSQPTPIDTLPAASNLTAIDDIKFMQNKVLTALRLPRMFLNFEENAGDGKNLALMDIRFTRTVNKIQQALLMELNKVAMIHLYLLGFHDDLTNFTLTMNNPSSQAEMLNIENLGKKIDIIKNACSDSGNGIPVMSLTRALKEIMKWDDNEITQNFEEIRLEKALAGELLKTWDIIKRTKIFDPVDRIYGEPGAEYTNTPPGETDSNMGGGGGFGGGGSFGGGLDLGGGEGDLSGEEGTMDMDTAVNDINGSIGGGDTGSKEGGSTGSPTTNEAIMHVLNDIQGKLLTEKKRLQIKESQRKRPSYFELYKKHMLDEQKKNEAPKPDYSSVFISEDVQQIMSELDKYLDKDTIND